VACRDTDQEEIVGVWTGRRHEFVWTKRMRRMTKKRKTRKQVSQVHQTFSENDALAAVDLVVSVTVENQPLVKSGHVLSFDLSSMIPTKKLMMKAKGAQMMKKMEEKTKMIMERREGQRSL